MATAAADEVDAASVTAIFELTTEAAEVAGAAVTDATDEGVCETCGAAVVLATTEVATAVVVGYDHTSVLKNQPTQEISPP